MGSSYFINGNYYKLRTFLLIAWRVVLRYIKMSVRNQLTHYELEEFFRSLQDLLGGLILFRSARRGGRRISSPAKSSSITSTKYFEQILWNIEPRAAWNTWSHNTHSGGWKLFFLLRVQSEIRQVFAILHSADFEYFVRNGTPYGAMLEYWYIEHGL